jgi:hypothetical protein
LAGCWFEVPSRGWYSAYLGKIDRTIQDLAWFWSLHTSNDAPTMALRESLFSLPHRTSSFILSLLTCWERIR